MMHAFEELVERCVLGRLSVLGKLSSQATEELRRDVKGHIEDFLDTPEQEAFYKLYQALRSYEDEREKQEGLADEEFLEQRLKLRESLEQSCKDVLALDESCVDAQRILALVADDDTNALLERLEVHVPTSFEYLEDLRATSDDAWADIYARPHLRMLTTYARTLLEAAHYKRAQAVCEFVRACSPYDEVGVVPTLALICARLEDEEALETLDRQTRRQGSTWMHLARTLLLFKLDRMDAAKRALIGFASMCTGGAYVLLRPFFVDSYIPDRPFFEEKSFEESVLAVHEAEPIIMDTPYFVEWAQDQPQVLEEAEAFAQQEGFDW